MSNIWYIIPAREGSKGMPHKNRKLFQFTIDSIPEQYRKNVIVTSDDPVIIDQAHTANCGACIIRKSHLAADDASTRDVIHDVINRLDVPDNDIVVLLYLTYPSRTWNDIQKAIKLLTASKERSLLCKKKLEISPYLMMFDAMDHKGSKVIDHDLCRRQDYKPCFLMSHYIGVFYANEVPKLDTNLWNRSTIFMPIDNKIDVDQQSDLSRYLTEKKDEC
jgi:CMP-N,N'-diacetyllegionaminic acid synthase